MVAALSSIIFCIHFAMITSHVVSLFRDERSRLSVFGFLQLYESEEVMLGNAPVYMRNGQLDFRVFRGAAESVTLLDPTNTIWHVMRTNPSGIVFSITGYEVDQNTTIDSMAYVSTSDGNESLLFSSTNISEVAAFREIGYTTFHRNSYAFATTRAGEVNPVDDFLQLEFRLGDTGPSMITIESFRFLEQIIRNERGLFRRERPEELWQIHLENCFERLSGMFPNIEYFFANEEQVFDLSSATIRIVFAPADYLIATSDPNVCNLEVDAPLFRFEPLILTDHLIRRISGLHFDYSNHRIGFFDAI